MKLIWLIGPARRLLGLAPAGPLAAAVILGLAAAPSRMDAAAAACHPERILVMPRPEVSAAALNQFHALHGRQVLRRHHRLGGLQVVRLRRAGAGPASPARPAEHVSEALAAYRASGLVAWAEPDHLARAAAVLPNDPYFQNGVQWGLNNYGQNGGLPDADLDAPEAWDARRAASNVVVAIVDSGVRPTHEDLAANLWRNPQDGSPGFNARTGGHDPWDDNGHGTHMAGLMGAATDNGRGIAGVAWQVRLMACKFLDAQGDGYYSDAIACIEFARSHGAHILNLSWTGTEFSAALSNALWAARADGLLVVAAAGNDGANTDGRPVYPAGLALDNLLAVGASTRTDEVWTFSNYGAASVHLFAPGVALYSAGTNSDAAYQSGSGTSMAAAVSSGALALLRAQFPQASAPELIAHLLGAADRRPAFAGKCRSGGRLNLRRALDLPGLSLAGRPDGVEVGVSGLPGHGYVLSASPNLRAWTALQTNILGPSGRWIFEDRPGPEQPVRFFRADPAP